MTQAAESMGENKSPLPRPSVDVALALIWDTHGKILICQRKPDTVLGGYWEFPGGKCQPAEPPAACAVREAREETALQVQVVRPLPPLEHDYPHARVRLHPFVCRWTAGTLQPRQVSAARWVAPADLPQYRFPEANAPLLRTILAGQANPESEPRP